MLSKLSRPLTSILPCSKFTCSSDFVTLPETNKAGLDCSSTDDSLSTRVSGVRVVEGGGCVCVEGEREVTLVSTESDKLLFPDSSSPSERGKEVQDTTCSEEVSSGNEYASLSVLG